MVLKFTYYTNQKLCLIVTPSIRNVKQLDLNDVAFEFDAHQALKWNKSDQKMYVEKNSVLLPDIQVQELKQPFSCIKAYSNCHSLHMGVEKWLWSKWEERNVFGV